MDWQLVLVAWGDKYGARHINALVEAAARASHPPRRTVLITDRLREGVDESVLQRDFPAEFYAARDENRRLPSQIGDVCQWRGAG